MRLQVYTAASTGISDVNTAVNALAGSALSDNGVSLASLTEAIGKNPSVVDSALALTDHSSGAAYATNLGTARCDRGTTQSSSFCVSSTSNVVDLFNEVYRARNGDGTGSGATGGAAGKGLLTEIGSNVSTTNNAIPCGPQCSSYTASGGRSSAGQQQTVDVLLHLSCKLCCNMYVISLQLCTEKPVDVSSLCSSFCVQLLFHADQGQAQVVQADGAGPMPIIGSTGDASQGTAFINGTDNGDVSASSSFAKGSQAVVVGFASGNNT